MFSDDEESEDGKEEEEEEDEAFISSRLASFESFIPFGLILGLGVIPEEEEEEEDEGGDRLSRVGVELLGIGAGTGRADVCMRSFTELATTLAFVAPITVSTAARAS